MTLSSARDRKNPNSNGKPDADASDETKWISTASALPIHGQPVEFVLDARECAITGTYAHGGFLSRWTRYAPELVCKWRGAIEDASSRACRSTPPPPGASMSP